MALAIFISVGVFLNGRANRLEASVSQASEYQSTTTRSAILGAPYTQITPIATGACVLGSVIITGAGTGVINIYDGTTTTSHADHATKTLAVFPASTAAGTYTFDLNCFKGLIIEVTGSAPTSTITFRP